MELYFNKAGNLFIHYRTILNSVLPFNYNLQYYPIPTVKSCFNRVVNIVYVHQLKHLSHLTKLPWIFMSYVLLRSLTFI